MSSDFKLNKDFTQEEIDKIFLDIKSEWDKIVADSGKSEQMVIALNIGGASEFIYHYWQFKEAAKEKGLRVPELVKGLRLSFED